MLSATWAAEYVAVDSSSPSTSFSSPAMGQSSMLWGPKHSVHFWMTQVCVLDFVAKHEVHKAASLHLALLPSNVSAPNILQGAQDPSGCA